MIDFVGNRTLRDLLDERAERDPDKVFLVFEDAMGDVREHTYIEFVEAVGRLAAGLAESGVGQGDAVTVHLPNCPEFMFAWFALGTLGAVMVPSNVANTGSEMEHVLDHSESVALVTEPRFMDMFRPILTGRTGVKHVVLARSAELEEGATILLDDLMAGSAEPERPTIDSEDVVEMIFTSGTTSRPKAVLLTHANCLRSGERVARSIHLDGSDRCLTALPAFHVNAQSVSVLSALTVGGTCILLEEYSAGKFWSQIRSHRATQTSLVAMQVRTLLSQPESKADSDHQLRRVFYAINVTDAEKEQFERRFNVKFINGYGLSEAMTIVTMCPVFGPKRWPSIGLSAFDRTIRIVDEDGNDVPTGTVGELIVYGIPGRTLMKGYFKDPEETRKAIRDGWLHTGDNAYIDETGYVYFFDRKKDVIKRAGENVSASEVEAVLIDNAKVAEAAVIAVPDAIRDEAVKAFVVPIEGETLTSDEVIEYCATRLARFKVPSFVEIRDSLPKTSIGKIEKKVLRAQEAEARGEA